jgi:hypothetical protein
MLTDFTLTEADIGRALDPADGFLVGLSQTAPAVPDGEPQWSAAMQRWKTGYISLRGESDPQAVYCNRPSIWTPLWSGGERILIASNSLPYAGRLRIECVPKGSTWSLTVSDVPFVRLADPGNHGNFINANYTPVNPPAAPKEARAAWR